MSTKTQENTCLYCGTTFKKLTTLSTHMCVKKQRHADINSAGARFGFIAFRRFYEISMNSKKPQTHQDFIDSPYYIDFVKFGNHLALLKPMYPEQFVDFVLRNGVNLKDWTKDFVYYTYLNDLIRKEPAMSATERTITEIVEWCDTNKVEFGEFFNSVNPNEAAYMIQMGKISPWVLYLSVNGGLLMDKFTDDHAKMINEMIDPGVWMKKFKKQNEDVDYIRNLLEQAGL